MADLEDLTQRSLHDVGVNSLAVDFEHRRLTLILAVYNEARGSYDPLKLEFSGLSRLYLGPLTLTAQGFEDLEVYSHTVTPMGTAHAIRFVLLTGQGQPSLDWCFTFEEVRRD